VGSSGHRVSESALTSVALGVVVQHLGQALARNLDELDSEYGRHRSKSLEPKQNAQEFSSASDHDTLDVVIKSVGKLQGNPERLEFLAKTLTAGPQMWQGKTRWVVLGTPLYVAMADCVTSWLGAARDEDQVDNFCSGFVGHFRSPLLEVS
jgi:hypothetical protein